MSPSLFLVTGGSGFLGINLCRLLLARGYSVRTLDLVPFDYPERDRVEAIVGDVRNPQTVANAMRGVEFVVHAAAALPLSSHEDIVSTDVEGTNIVLASAFKAGIARVIYISSTSVYGIPDHHPLLETDRLHGVGPYGEAKIAAENHCHRFRNEGHCVPVLRPKSFVGPERLGMFELLYDWAFEARSFPVLGEGNNLYQLLDVEDLCEVILRCVSFDVAEVADTFNVGAKEYGSMRDNFQTVLDRAGHGRQVVSLPKLPAIMMLRVLEFLQLSPIYQWVYDTAGEESFVSIDKLREKLGFVPKFSNREALIRNYDWYVQHRDEYLGKTGVSHRLPWKRGALGLAKHLF
ncbi:NAD(P)-dependent oxidoreductase [uncultured Nevskia sp.]|uniref:NAD-dependent epimerase/dehydratase family protein n=1 Tax=uncultured Nevskia sp. TaxID=228950 RepID=UPI0025D01256|nr:NAD(P)-dependent oxidoreductase [uncultured Nevskia sp.]